LPACATFNWLRAQLRRSGHKSQPIRKLIDFNFKLSFLNVLTIKGETNYIFWITDVK